MQVMLEGTESARGLVTRPSKLRNNLHQFARVSWSAIEILEREDGLDDWGHGVQ